MSRLLSVSLMNLMLVILPVFRPKLSIWNLDNRLLRLHSQHLKSMLSICHI